jgi:predicted aminopeptidase
MLLPARFLLLLVVLAPLAGCYVMHAARGQWEVMSKRRPIPEVIADAAAPARLKERLQTVLDIRAFSVDALGLPDNDSYRSYSDVEREFVVWNVFATHEFSVEPKQWCFPIAGCVNYRGYFDAKKTADFAASLRRKGLDVSIGAVPAYSTLGHFADPVLNTMMHWSDVQLAAIIFHELTHQVLYVPGDSMFNEAFATVVEEEGVRRWLAAQGRTAELESFQQRRHRYLAFSSLLENTRERLRALYATEASAPQLRRGKAAAFARLRGDYEALKLSWGGRGDFDTWFDRPLNNSHLVSVATYQQCVPGLAAVLREEQGDLDRFYERARELAGLDLQERHRRVCRP